MSAVRDALDAEQQAIYDQAIAAAGEVYAEGIARQDARPPHEAALAALGRDATPDQVEAWIGRHRPEGTAAERSRR
jgi:cation transport regulator ChaB